jgi:malate dehydrogenase (oxaloacetate-decarboxylating)
MLNRGTAFTHPERRALGLQGLLPSGASTLEGQLRRVYAQYQRQPDDLAKHVYLANLRDRNEILFYRLLTDHLEEMLPIVYTPTVGKAIERYSHEYRRPRGVFLSVNHPEEVEESLRSYGLDGEDVDLLVATDSEGILGIGDQGVGGIEISIGKLALYIAAAGLHPRRVIPVVLDMGTDNLALLNDAMYIGNRHARVRDQRYDDLIDAYVTAATKLFPHAMQGLPHRRRTGRARPPARPATHPGHRGRLPAAAPVGRALGRPLLGQRGDKRPGVGFRRLSHLGQDWLPGLWPGGADRSEILPLSLQLS